MYFFVFAPLLKDKKVINETNFFAFSRLIKKDPNTFFFSIVSFFSQSTKNMTVYKENFSFHWSILQWQATLRGAGGARRGRCHSVRPKKEDIRHIICI